MLGLPLGAPTVCAVPAPPVPVEAVEGGGLLRGYVLMVLDEMLGDTGTVGVGRLGWAGTAGLRLGPQQVGHMFRCFFSF